MSPFSKNSTGLLLLLVGVLACSTLLKPAEARAKSGLFGSNEEESDWDNWGFDKSKEESDDDKAPEEPAGGADHSHHHHHEEPRLAAASSLGLGSQGAQAASWDPKQSGEGLQSGNFAAHNESCSPTGKSCPKEQNLECSSTDGTGRCQCTSSYVYVQQTESCWYIPKSDQDACAHDVQCHSGTWGSHSRCNKQNARCECFDYATNGKRQMVLVDGICYIKKSVGDLCRNHEECDKPIRGDAYCRLGDHQSSGGQNYNGSCQCRETHMYYPIFPACLQLATKLGDKCHVTEQCQDGSLGKRSKCVLGAVEGEGVCQCHSQNNATEVVYYEKLAKCFKRKEYNDTCENEDECRASLGPDVECGTTEEYPEDKICHCPKGKVCRNSAFSVLLATSTYTLSMGFAAAFVGVSSMMSGIGNFGGC